MGRYTSQVDRCIVTHKYGCDLHHLKTRKSGGTDDPWNLMPLSREMHRLCHDIGLVAFANKYNSVKSWLIENGWEYEEFRNKWVRYQEDE